MIPQCKTEIGVDCKSVGSNEVKPVDEKLE